MSSGGSVERNGISIYLHQSSLHVPSFCGLDRGIDQTFSTRNCVEQKLGRCQSREEAIAHKSFGWRVFRLLGKVRKRSILETIGNTLAGYTLLAHASNHLRHIDGRTYKFVISPWVDIVMQHKPFEPAVAMMRGAL